MTKLTSLSELKYQDILPRKRHQDDLYLNPRQQSLYNQSRYGLDALPPREVKRMPPEERRSVESTKQRAQRILNLYKQRKCNEISAKILGVVKTSTDLIKGLLTDDSVSNEFVNTLSFKDLKIGRKDIIDQLITGRVLPPNFYQL